MAGLATRIDRVPRDLSMLGLQVRNRSVRSSLNSRIRSTGAQGFANHRAAI